MKKLAVVSFSLFLFSCENTWDSEARDLFHAGCMEAAKEAYMLCKSIPASATLWRTLIR